jgi:hypothetical protein
MADVEVTGAGRGARRRQRGGAQGVAARCSGRACHGGGCMAAVTMRGAPQLTRTCAPRLVRATHTPEVDPEYVFSFPDPGAAGVSPPILGFHDVDFAYEGGPTLFKGLNFGLVRALAGQWVTHAVCMHTGVRMHTAAAMPPPRAPRPALPLLRCRDRTLRAEPRSSAPTASASPRCWASSAARCSQQRATSHETQRCVARACMRVFGGAQARQHLPQPAHPHTASRAAAPPPPAPAAPPPPAGRGGPPPPPPPPPARCASLCSASTTLTAWTWRSARCRL